LPFITGSRGAVVTTLDFTAAFVRTETRGLESGKTLKAENAFWGVAVGFESEWTPVPRVPVTLHLGTTIIGMIPVVPVHTADAYAPYEGALDASRLSIGLAWRWR
jgi:hypothetical protein